MVGKGRPAVDVAIGVCSWIRSIHWLTVIRGCFEYWLASSACSGVEAVSLAQEGESNETAAARFFLADAFGKLSVVQAFGRNVVIGVDPVPSPLYSPWAPNAQLRAKGEFLGGSWRRCSSTGHC